MKTWERPGGAGLVIIVGLVLALAAALASDSAIQASGNGICDRTQQVQDAILAKLADVSDCADVTDTDLDGISGEIIILDQESLTLQNGDFRGLTGLETLYIHHNGLNSLPEDVFDGLASLKTLYLYNNKLTTLPGDVFNGLTDLEFLSLSYNSISTLPGDVFERLVES